MAENKKALAIETANENGNAALTERLDNVAERMAEAQKATDAIAKEQKLRIAEQEQSSQQQKLEQEQMREQARQGGFYNNTQQQHQQQDTGNVKVYTTNEQPRKRINDDVGDYVDFEEVEQPKK